MSSRADNHEVPGGYNLAPEMSERRAIIVGGGPAGSAAAILLARQDWRVDVIEQHRFPRDKVCGECLSALGMDVLGRLGLADAVRGAGSVELRRSAIHAMDGSSARVDLARPMWGLSRSMLDTLLLDAARDAGAVIHQPARCERLTPGERPTVRVRRLIGNEVIDLD